LNFASLTTQIIAYGGTGLVTVVAILLFIGPMGKSAQFPLHVWLPDAMEGPTPVSALIHAATMVAAGVYLLSRCFLIFHSSVQAMAVIAVIGGITALFAASIALVQNDIKRILAYSTLSQLGYMVMAVGIGAMTAAMFHLVTHAFFKSLLFLGAGSVIHAMHDEQDIWKMGNLSKKMPITTVTFIIGALALAGIPPLAGFWSKDEILLGAFAEGYMAFYAIGSLVAFMTAFYMFRLIFTAFYGKNTVGEHAHESPLVMTVPLMILAGISIFAGFLGSPFTDNLFGHYITYAGAVHHEPSLMIMAVSTVIALAGIYLAYLVYQKRIFRPEEVKERLPGLYNVLYHKYYVDEFYALLVSKVIDGMAKVVYWIDLHIVNGFINFLAFTTYKIGDRLKLFQDGQVQTSALVMYIGLGVIVITSVLAVFYAAII
jgi:NADH-quinone oxidoreductase subunit L